jgi:hypothetical protein
VVPTPKKLPLAGPAVLVNVSPLEQLSLNVGVLYVTFLPQLPDVLTEMLLGQEMEGGWLSLTNTTALQLSELPLLSVTVRVTLLLPMLLQLKLDGLRE